MNNNKEYDIIISTKPFNCYYESFNDEYEIGYINELIPPSINITCSLSLIIAISFNHPKFRNYYTIAV